MSWKRQSASARHQERGRPLRRVRTLRGRRRRQRRSRWSAALRRPFAGDRQANHAHHAIVLVRMKCDQRTQDYVARPTAEAWSRRTSSAAYNGSSPETSIVTCPR